MLSAGYMQLRLLAGSTVLYRSQQNRAQVVSVIVASRREHRRASSITPHTKPSEQTMLTGISQCSDFRNPRIYQATEQSTAELHESSLGKVVGSENCSRHRKKPSVFLSDLAKSSRLRQKEGDRDEDWIVSLIISGWKVRNRYCAGRCEVGVDAGGCRDL